MSWIAIIVQIFDTNKGINTRENIICRILPKHLLNCVCLSMKTFAEMTFPNGRNVETRSVSLNSCGRWYINKLQPSGPSICLSVLVNFAFWAAAAAAAAAAVNAGNPESRKIRHHRFSYSPLHSSILNYNIACFFTPHEIRTLITAIIDSITAPNYRRYNIKLIIGPIADLNYRLIFGRITVLDHWRYKMVDYWRTLDISNNWLSSLDYYQFEFFFFPPIFHEID